MRTRCALNGAFRVAAEARALLAEAGISLSGKQQTKTSKALKYFAAELS